MCMQSEVLAKYSLSTFSMNVQLQKQSSSALPCMAAAKLFTVPQLGNAICSSWELLVPFLSITAGKLSRQELSSWPWWTRGKLHLTLRAGVTVCRQVKVRTAVSGALKKKGAVDWCGRH